MMWIKIFIILVLNHFVSDWILQPTYWGFTKMKSSKTRFYHSIQYAIFFIPAFYFLNINFLWLLYLFATHFIIDSYVIINWWDKNIRNAINKKRIPKNEPPRFVSITEDQIIHILLLISIAI
ncbi:MAG: DUF3307 domain-containing protein [Candidatus Pacearchaeota archaeon]|nr:DUF3307 domain-containing protein [Candidatus Pacearchaeota archaeon]